MESLKILSVNISDKKGIKKKAVGEILVDMQGVKNDAHAGDWQRQVSLLGKESIDKFSAQAGRSIQFGEFAENLTTQGIELYKTRIFDRFQINKVLLEVSQIGKECHGTSCAIFKEAGNCVMPKEGIFCRVLQAGNIKEGDSGQYIPKVFKVGVITLSDRASRGEYSDRSGPRIMETIKAFFDEKKYLSEVLYLLIPDDAQQLKKGMRNFVKQECDIIFTTGGTGIGSKDITTDVVKPLLQKEIPGIMDHIRFKYGAEKPNALISRSVAGIINKTIIFTLPGSVKAVDEYLQEITKVLMHLTYMLHDIDAH